MIALCYEQTPKQSMFPFAIMLQILKNHYFSFDCEMSLVIACQIYLLNETWLHSQSGILFSDEDYTFHSLSTIIYGFRRLEIQHNAFVMLLYCVSATFFYNTVLSLYIYLPGMCVYCLYCTCQMFGNITICIFLMKSHQVWIDALNTEKNKTLILWNSITI